MEILRYVNISIILLVYISWVTRVLAQTTPTQRVLCISGPCRGRLIRCPTQCPSRRPNNPKDKACFADCSSPTCEAVCKNRVPNCNGFGAACYDPRFIGGDGIVFYFHGKSNEHFSLVTDTNLQINARFIGHRPAGRTRDFTWIQALGVLFDSHAVSIEATKATKWDDEIDHLKFSYNGEEVFLPERSRSEWSSQDDGNVKLERITAKNSVILSIPEVVEVAVNVVPITKEEDRVHNYQIPLDDCFAHLEVQFTFFGLSAKVDGVIGQTYRPDFESPAKLGAAMPVFGGEDKYRTTSLLSADCRDCLYDSSSNVNKDSRSPLLMEYGTLKCSSGLGNGVGIVCKK